MDPKPMWSNPQVSTKVKQLADEVGLQPYYDEQEMHIQLFAEKIINECIRLLPEDCNVAGVHSSWIIASHFQI